VERIGKRRLRYPLCGRPEQFPRFPFRPSHRKGGHSGAELGGVFDGGGGGGIERGAARIVSETIALSNGGGFYTSGITEIPALGVIKPQLRIGCSRTGDQINGFVTEILIYSGTPLTDDQITAPAL
jgi:hypothetical protein